MESTDTIRGFDAAGWRLSSSRLRRAGFGRMFLYWAVGIVTVFYPHDNVSLGMLLSFVVLGVLQPLTASLAPPVRARAVLLTLEAALLLALSVQNPIAWHAAIASVLLNAGPISVAVPRTHLVAGVSTALGTLLAVGVAQDTPGWQATMPVAGAALLFVVWRAQLERSEILSVGHNEQVAWGSKSLFQVRDRSSGEVVVLVGDVVGITGWSAAEWKKIPFHSVVHTSDLDRIAGLERLAGGGRLAETIRMRTKMGEWRFVHVTAELMSSGYADAVRTTLTDITDRHQLTVELRDAADRDHLTGLGSRSQLKKAIEHAQGTRSRFGLVLMDINGFKAINDTLGQSVGDLILAMMADRLRAEIGDSGEVYRLGDDEFVAMLHGATDRGTVAEVALRLARVCKAPYNISILSLAAPVSIGTSLPTADLTPDECLRRADVALCASKTSEQEVCEYHPELDCASVRNLSLTASVASALDSGELQLYFQPQVDLATGAIVGFEGLARWDHPDYGLLHPAEILACIRTAGYQNAWTLRMLEQGAELAREMGPEIKVSVNVSVTSIREDDCVEEMIRIKRRTGLSDGQLVIEFTETEVARIGPGLLDPIEQLRNAGFEISIDDFGTGHSSYERLRSLAADEIKIEHIFINGLSEGGVDEVLTRSMVRIANELGIRVIAEGVEDMRQLEMLREMGCRTGQGFLFAQAMSHDEIRALLTDAATRGAFAEATAPGTGMALEPYRPIRVA